MTQIQTLTVLRSFGPVLAKRWLADGGLGDYDLARNFSVSTENVSTVSDLHAMLRRLQADPKACLIRGELAYPEDYNGRIERRLGYFHDVPSRLLMVDIDTFTPQASVLDDPEGAVLEAIDKLPAPLRDASCVYQLSGSCGHPTKGNALRVHLFYLLAEPLSCDQLEAWAMRYLPGTDPTVHRTVQVNYTSLPVLDEGQTDPLAGRRLALLPSFEEFVTIPADMPVPDVSSLKRVTRAQRATMADPREKPGFLGALARLYTPEQLPELFPDHFEEGRTPERLTWLKGGGSKEGLRVTDNGTHVYNSHATSPVRGAVSLFDFVRTHVFGHLDDGIDPEVLELDITAAPSYKAARSWALSLPGMQEELNSPKAEAAAEAAEESKAQQTLSKRADLTTRMENIKALIAKAPDVYVLELELARRIKSADNFSAAERENIAKEIQKRTAMLGNKLPIAVIRTWLIPEGPTVMTWPSVDQQGLPRRTLENLQALLQFLGVTVRYNCIAHDLEIQAPNIRATPDNFNAVALARMLSACQEHSLHVNERMLAAYLLAVADENVYNPVEDWVKSRPWDGRSRFEDFMGTMTLSPDMNPELARIMIRTWLVQTLALALSDRPLQGRGVLTLMGRQYMGKSRWLQKLTGPLCDLFKGGHILDVNSRDSVAQATSVWICELGEIDSTFKRSEVAALKAFIALEADTYRRPYAVREATYQRRTSLCGSVNHEEILQDSSGNTRFWCLPLLDLNPDHQIDTQQLWAEVLTWWEAGERHYMSREAMERLSEHSERHTITDPLEELIRTRFPWEQAAQGCDSVRWEVMRATELLRRVGSDRMDKRMAGQASAFAQKLGASKVALPRVEGGGFGLRVPVHKDDLAELTD